MKDILESSFQSVFGKADGIRYFFAPGRVNLMGDHVDYNGGMTLPCALTLGTYAAVRKNTLKKARFFSLSYREEGIKSSSLDELAYQKELTYANYPLGVLAMLKMEGYEIAEGFDVLYGSTLPSSSGLSSSASIEVLTATFLCALFKINLSTLELAQLSRKAENEFIGMNCGILDQLSVAAGKKDYAIYLDTGTCVYEYAPFELNDCALIIVNSNKSRQLSGSKYNERRQECERALEKLQGALYKKDLCSYTVEEFEQVAGVLHEDTLFRRARHAVYENLRTQLSYQALKRGAMDEFGALMTASHLSLKEDYEVSCRETDFLVEQSVKRKGVYGARMTGAGFGGCVITLLKKREAEEYISFLREAYEKETGLKPDFYFASAGDGPIEF